MLLALAAVAAGLPVANRSAIAYTAVPMPEIADAVDFISKKKKKHEKLNKKSKNVPNEARHKCIVKLLILSDTMLSRSSNACGS